MRKFIPHPIALWVAPSILLLAACAQPQEESGGESAASQDASEASAEPDAKSGDDATSFEAVQMPVMSQTGWRVLGEDGAVYTTFFDADGSYRDFKNGEPMQTGTWEERVDGKLCFTPAEEGRIGECWKLDRVGSDGMMKPVSDAGKTIELRQVTYIAAEDEG